MCCSHSSSDEIRAANSGEWDRVPGGGDEVIVLLNRRLVGSDRFVATHYKRVLLAATPSCSFAIVCFVEQPVRHFSSIGRISKVGPRHDFVNMRVQLEAIRFMMRFFCIRALIHVENTPS